jgi:hypothetical protein
VRATCPTLGLTLVHPERASHLSFQIHGLALEAGRRPAKRVTAAVVAVGGVIGGEGSLQVVQMPMPEALRSAYCCQFSLGRERAAAGAGQQQQQQQQQAQRRRDHDERWARFDGGGGQAEASASSSAAAGDAPSPSTSSSAAAGASGDASGRPGAEPHPGHVYGDSLVSSYLPHARLQLAPALLRLQPATLSEALLFIERVKRCFESGLPARGNALQEAEPLQNVVVAAYKRHRVPLPYALSSFVPTLSVRCPQLVVVAALRGGGALRSGPLALGAGGRHELVAVMEALSAGVRYETSCYSSLVRQLHATADAEVFFQQHRDAAPAASSSSPSPGATPVPAAASAAATAGPYSALWLHPEDVEQLLMEGSRRVAAVAAAAAAAGAGAASAPATPHGARGVAGGAAVSKPSAVPPGLSGLPSCQPFVPLVRARHLVLQLATQILNEPSVPGSEAAHTTAHAAGVQAWLSPWQADLLLEAADQLLSDALQLRRSFINDILAPSVGQRARRPRGATAAGFALATAAKVVQPRTAAAGQRRVPAGGAAAAAAAAAVLADAAEAAGTRAGDLQSAAVAAAGKGSSFLLDLPLFELLVFSCMPSKGPLAGGSPAASHGQSAAKSSGSSDGYRFAMRPAEWVPARPAGDPRPQQQNQQQLLAWAEALVPAASLVLTELRCGAHLGPTGELMAKGRLGSFLAVNLQLAKQGRCAASLPIVEGALACRIAAPQPAAPPSPAPASVTAPPPAIRVTQRRPAPAAGSAAAAVLQGISLSSPSAAAAGEHGAASAQAGSPRHQAPASVAAQQAPAEAAHFVGLDLNRNALLVAPYTARACATYRFATERRRLLMHLGTPAAQPGGGAAAVAAAGSGGALPILPPSAAAAPPRPSLSSGAAPRAAPGMLVTRPSLTAAGVLRQRWQRALELRLLGRASDYALCLLAHRYRHGGRAPAAAPPAQSSGEGLAEEDDAGGGAFVIGAAVAAPWTPLEEYKAAFADMLAARGGGSSSGSGSGAAAAASSGSALPISNSAVSGAASPRGPAGAASSPPQQEQQRPAPAGGDFLWSMLGLKGRWRGDRRGPSADGAGGHLNAAAALARSYAAPASGGSGSAPQPGRPARRDGAWPLLQLLPGRRRPESVEGTPTAAGGTAAAQSPSAASGGSPGARGAPPPLAFARGRISTLVDAGAASPAAARVGGLFSGGWGTQPVGSRVGSADGVHDDAAAARPIWESAAARARRQHNRAARRGLGAHHPQQPAEGNAAGASAAIEPAHRLCPAEVEFVDAFVGAQASLGTGFSAPQAVAVYRRSPAPTTASAQAGPGSSSISSGGGSPSEDGVLLSLGAVHVTAGPHTTSVMLQLASSFLPVLSGRTIRGLEGPPPEVEQRQGSGADDAAAAAAAAAEDGPAPPTGGRPAWQQPSQQQLPEPAAASRSSVCLQAALLAVTVNVEEPAATNGGGVTRAKGLASVLCLDSCAVLGPYRGAGFGGGSSGGADPLAHSAGAPAAASLAVLSIGHVGMLDLQAPLEQRHVLSFNPSPPGGHPLDGDVGGVDAACCSLSVRALIPIGGGEQAAGLPSGLAAGEPPAVPHAVLVDVANPRVIVLRRFVNNVLHASTIITRELDTYQRVISSASWHADADAPSAAAAHAARPRPTAAALLQLTNMQVVYPASHASKTLDDQYARAAELASASRGTGRRTRTSKGGRTSAAGAAQSGGGAAVNDAPAAARGVYPCAPQPVRHAFYKEALVVNVSAAAVAAPGVAPLLSAIGDFAGEQGLYLPPWMQDRSEPAQLVLRSRAMLQKHSSPAAPAPAPAPADQQAAAGSGPPDLDVNLRSSTDQQQQAAGPDPLSPVHQEEPAQQQQQQQQQQQYRPFSPGQQQQRWPSPSGRRPGAPAPEPGMLMVRPGGERDLMSDDAEEEAEAEAAAQQKAAKPKLLQQAGTAAMKLLGRRPVIDLPNTEAVAAQAAAVAPLQTAATALPTQASAGAARGPAAPAPSATQQPSTSAGAPAAAGAAASGAAAAASRAPPADGARAEAASAGSSSSSSSAAPDSGEPQALLLVEGFELLAADVVRCSAPGLQRARGLGSLGDMAGLAARRLPHGLQQQRRALAMVSRYPPCGCCLPLPASLLHATRTNRPPPPAGCIRHPLHLGPPDPHPGALRLPSRRLQLPRPAGGALSGPAAAAASAAIGRARHAGARAVDAGRRLFAPPTRQLRLHDARLLREPAREALHL